MVCTAVAPLFRPIPFIHTHPGMFSPLTPDPHWQCFAAVIHSCYPTGSSGWSPPALYHFPLYPLALDPQIHPFFHVFNLVPSVFVPGPSLRPKKPQALPLDFLAKTYSLPFLSVSFLSSKHVPGSKSAGCSHRRPIEEHSFTHSSSRSSNAVLLSASGAAEQWRGGTVQEERMDFVPSSPASAWFHSQPEQAHFLHRAGLLVTDGCVC